MEEYPLTRGARGVYFIPQKKPWKVRCSSTGLTHAAMFKTRSRQTRLLRCSKRHRHSVQLSQDEPRCARIVR